MVVEDLPKDIPAIEDNPPENASVIVLDVVLSIIATVASTPGPALVEVEPKTTTDESRNGPPLKTRLKIFMGSVASPMRRKFHILIWFPGNKRCNEFLRQLPARLSPRYTVHQVVREARSLGAPLDQ